MDKKSVPTSSPGSGADIPVGFGMALAMNADAMVKFASLGESERLAVIERARRASSKAEMTALVQNIAEGSAQPSVSDIKTDSTDSNVIG